MSVPLKYIGASTRYFDTVAGSREQWTPGDVSDVADAAALALIQTGKFAAVAGAENRYTAAQLTAFAAAGGLTQYSTYVSVDTGRRWWALSASALEPFNWARIIGGDVRASLTTAKASIHAANGVVSAGPGLLIGIEVIAPGSADSTITLHDNASAASGTVRRKVYANDPSNVAGGWHDADGRNGIPFSNGIYISFTGTTPPVVLVYFDGTYPDWADWSGVQTWYFDSVAGSNTTGDGSQANPYKEVYGFPSNFLNATDAQKICLFKAGQSHHYGRTVSGSTNMPGTNIKVKFDRYGDASLPNPVLWMDVGDDLNNHAVEATGGLFECNNIAWEYRTAFTGSASFTGAQVAAASGTPVLSAPFPGPTGNYMLVLYTSGVPQATRKSNVTLTNGATTVTWAGGGTITCDASFTWESSHRNGGAVFSNSGARIVIDNCTASRFVNGFVIGSDDSRVTRSTVLASSTGIYGDASAGHGTASRMLIHACTVPSGGAFADAITLHDGETSDGFDNVISCCVLYAGSEQCVDNAPDVTYKYKRTLIGHNYCYVGANSTGAITTDVGGDGATMVGNEVTGPGTNGPSFMARCPANYIGNVTDRVISNSQGQLDMGDVTWAAAGSVVLFNTLVTPATGAIRVSVKASAGTINCVYKFNLLVSLSNQRINNINDLTGWSIDYNAYYYPAITSGGAGLTAIAFQHGGSTQAKTAWQANLAGACDTNSYFQANPALVGTYQLPALSQFIAAGAAHPARYMLWSGPSWMDGPVSIGADEWQGNRRAP